MPQLLHFGWGIKPECINSSSTPTPTQLPCLKYVPQFWRGDINGKGTNACEKIWYQSSNRSTYGIQNNYTNRKQLKVAEKSTSLAKRNAIQMRLKSKPLLRAAESSNFYSEGKHLQSFFQRVNRQSHSFKHYSQRMWGMTPTLDFFCIKVSGSIQSGCDVWYQSSITCHRLATLSA